MYIVLAYEIQITYVILTLCPECCMSLVLSGTASALDVVIHLADLLHISKVLLAQTSQCGA